VVVGTGNRAVSGGVEEFGLGCAGGFLSLLFVGAMIAAIDVLPGEARSSRALTIRPESTVIHQKRCVVDGN
jgi:hypothetical protein